MKKIIFLAVFFAVLFVLVTCTGVAIVPAFADAYTVPPPGESSGSGPLLLILILVLVGTIALLINGLKRVTKEPSNLTLNSAAQQTSSGFLGFLDFGFTRFITNSLTSFIWMAVVAIVFLVWGYQTYTIVQGSLSGGLLIMLLSMTASNPPLMNFLLITLDAVICLLVARMTLEFIIIVFRIETRLRTIEENAEKMSRVASDLRAIRDNTDNTKTRETNVNANNAPKEPQV